VYVASGDGATNPGDPLAAKVNHRGPFGRSSKSHRAEPLDRLKLALLIGSLLLLAWGSVTMVRMVLNMKTQARQSIVDYQAHVIRRVLDDSPRAKQDAMVILAADHWVRVPAADVQYWVSLKFGERMARDILLDPWQRQSQVFIRPGVDDSIDVAVHSGGADGQFATRDDIIRPVQFIEAILGVTDATSHGSDTNLDHGDRSVAPATNTGADDAASDGSPMESGNPSAPDAEQSEHVDIEHAGAHGEGDAPLDHED